MSDANTQQEQYADFPREANVEVTRDAVIISISTDDCSYPTKDFLEAVAELKRMGIDFVDNSEDRPREVRIPIQRK